MNNGLEIAIVGMAGRFPGARNVTEFWQNLQQGKESIYFYSPQELQELRIDQETSSKPNFVNAGGKLEDINLFAADFFGFNPREAELLDPQHRLFLETAWTALEDAGYDGQNYPGSVGVFGGAGMNGYRFNLYRNAEIRENTNKYQLFLASETDFLTTRVSYKLSLEGSSVNVQTACSTSLVAVHLACQSLLSGECDMALAGGVAISLSAGYLHQEGGIYSPDGHCRAFDSNASGTIGGSGVGIVVLKRLEDAQSDRDNILAVIKGSATNNDGETKVSYTAPRIDTQAQVIRSAQLVAEVEPDTISYIETHGTGTSLGDPIEVAALTQAFIGTDKKQYCAIASVKPNIGHLDAAAGIASLIKTVLALQHKQIPPSINCDRPNPQIDWDSSPFFVNRELTNWESNEHPRRAGVSSFGIGGTNVHVVLEEAGEQGSRGAGEQGSICPNVLVLSAKTKTALDKMTGNLGRYLEDNPDVDLARVAYTLQVGRRAFDYRRMIVVQTVEDARESLKIIATDRVFTNKIEPGYKPVVFMFSGQGSQYENMGWGLYQQEPVFRENCDRCFQILDKYLDVSLKDIIFVEGRGLFEGRGQKAALKDIVPLWYTPSDKGRGFRTTINNQQSTINDTEYAQLAIFVIEYALAQLWMDWGIMPEVLIGHSIGEYVAATIAGVFDLEDALKIVATRANLMQQQPAGVMLSVALSAKEIEQYLKGEVSLAVSNAPSLCAVSGEEKAIASLETVLQDKGIACRRLKTSHGFHSSLMDGAIAPLVKALEKTPLHAPRIPFISNVTGTWITNQQATNPEYWGEHLRQTVRFAEGIEEIVKEPNRILLEVGAGKTLTTLAQQISKQHVALTSIRHPKDKPPLDKGGWGDLSFLLNTCGRLWLAGVNISWDKLHSDKPYRVSLPTYPFERQRYWIEPDSVESNLPTTTKQRVSNSNSWFYIPTWSKVLPLPKIDSAELAQNPNLWLIFADELGVVDSLKESLVIAKQQVITVITGEEFKVVDESQVTCPPQGGINDRHNYEELWQYLSDRDFIPSQIIYFPENCKGEWHSPIASNNISFSNLLDLVKTLGEQRLDNSIQISVLVNNLQDIIGTEDIQLNNSTLTGITTVISQEYPQIDCRVIDLDRIERRQKAEGRRQKEGESLRVDDFDYLVSEILTPSNISIAYRCDRRWQKTYENISLDSNKTRLRSQGIYLVFGSINSSLGRVWAEYLQDKFQVRVVLVGDVEDAGAKGIRPINADINDKEAVRNAIAEVESSLGEIDGVFYSTPMTNQNSASIIAELNSSHWKYNYRTKINPLHILAECLADKQLDFVLVQSSLSSILGGLGLAAYAGANCYLDAFVEQQNNLPQNHTPWFSVNWDACQTETEKQNISGIGASLSEYSLTPQEIGEATEKILALAAGSQIIVSKGDLQARIDRWLPSTPKDEPETKVNNIEQHSRPNLTTEYVAPSNETEIAIAEIWQQVLGIDRVGVNDSFFELGGHSLLTIQTISRIREKFNVELAMSAILAETPTVGNLAASIIEQQPDAAELATIEELLAEVQNMSPEEIAKQLEQRS
ncbi:MAG: beta-ketoacyl synthase N-terminal-like domain-containing protein [Cyanobacteria bacterium P01_G01_bin.19]